MRLPAPLYEGTLVRRYQRFLADVRLPEGEVVTAHCANSGTMRTCAVEGGRVLLSKPGREGRKLAWTWEIAFAGDGGDVAVLVNTGRPGGIVREAVEAGGIPELRGYGRVRAEVAYGEERSRVDLLLEGGAGPDCLVEVKSVTLRDRPGLARFPDAVTSRGARHLRELARGVAGGRRGVLFFLVSRGDAEAVAPADDVDPVYGRALREAVAAGVEVLAFRARVGPGEVQVERRLPVILS